VVDGHVSAHAGSLAQLSLIDRDSRDPSCGTLPSYHKYPGELAVISRRSTLIRGIEITVLPVRGARL
jgi:hypothetical protein